MDIINKKWTIKNKYRMSGGSLGDQVSKDRKTNQIDYGEPVLHSPFLFKDMEIATEIIENACLEGKKILIHGDYDVDGISSCALLHTFFADLGIETDIYIPSRLIDGYGLTQGSVDYIIKEKIDLVITVDCGITSVSEIKTLKEHGIQVILTDHHQGQETIPEADAVINPSLKTEPYPFAYLSGSGVALKLIQALCETMGLDEDWQDYIDLASLGTVADVMPLLGENAKIVQLAIEQMNNNPRLGLQALLKDQVVLDTRTISAQTISFFIAPRLNAAGRMDVADTALQLLLTQSPIEAEHLAKKIEELNTLRQQEEKKAYAEACQQVAKNANLPVILVESPDWHPGIVGIVAAKLVQKFYRPAIVFQRYTDNQKTYLKGSARSLPSINLFKILSGTSSLFTRFGGHPQAAGLELVYENFEALKNYLATVEELQDPELFKPTQEADLYIPSAAISLEEARSLEKIKPYGQCNPEPIFLARNIKIVSGKRIGKDQSHLKLSIETQENKEIPVIAFGKGDWLDIFLKPHSNQLVDMLFQIDINIWKDKEILQLKLVDCKYIQDDLLDLSKLSKIPEKRYNIGTKEFQNFYHALREFLGTDVSIFSLPYLYSYLIRRTQIADLTCLHLLLTIFEEAELLYKMQWIKNTDVYMGYMKTVDKKARLSQTNTYKLYFEG